MGSCGELYIDNYLIYSIKNYVDPLLLSIFQRSDLKKYERKISQRRQIYFSRDSEKNEIERAFEFSNNAKNIKHRLGIMGFSLEKVKREFEIYKNREIETHTELLKQKWVQENPDIMSKKMCNINILKNSTFEDFLNASKEILNKKIPYDFKIEELPTNANPLIHFILEFHNGFESLPHLDPRTILFSLLEVSSDNTIVTYDITELVEGGYVEEADTLFDETIKTLNYNYELDEKIVILAEGSTDMRILKESLEILFPHVNDLYSFMDFHVSNAQGSASILINTLKSFIGAGIKNRIIALFDNDAAAKSALFDFKNVIMPLNIKIIQYPNLNFAKTYPTLGPSGINNLDINGLACSIELYLGKEIITNDKGKFIPIQWKGYNKLINKYQGEILYKNKIQKQFINKIKDCKKNKNHINNYDWEPLKLIFENIFDAFK